MLITLFFAKASVSTKTCPTPIKWVQFTFNRYHQISFTLYAYGSKFQSCTSFTVKFFSVLCYSLGLQKALESFCILNVYFKKIDCSGFYWFCRLQGGVRVIDTGIWSSTMFNRPRYLCQSWKIVAVCLKKLLTKWLTTGSGSIEK